MSVNLPPEIEKEFEEGYQQTWRDHHMEDHCYAELKQFSRDFISRVISQTREETLKEVESVMPKKKGRDCKCPHGRMYCDIHSGSHSVADTRSGFNNCRTSFLTALEKLKNTL